MARLCERPGCSVPADVSYGFDAEVLVVWLDAFDAAQGARAGVLCRRHADAMVVPLGWMLDDRREPAPRLFRAPAEAPTKPTVRRPRTHHAPVVQLALHTDDATGELVVSPASLAAARALDDTQHDDRDATAEVPAPQPTADPEPLDEHPDVLPWQPRFDQHDDLSGLLKARGRLLSRAFNGLAADGG